MKKWITVSLLLLGTLLLAASKDGKTKKRGFIHEYQMPPEINYHLNLVQLDFKEVFLEKRSCYNLVFVYSKEGKEMAVKWNHGHGYHILPGVKKGYFSVPFSEGTPPDSLLADTLVVNIKQLFQENPKRSVPDDVRRIWDNLYDFGTITLIKKDNW